MKINTNIDLAFITLALQELRSGVAFHISSNDTGVEILGYEHDNTIPSEAELLAKAQELSDKADSESYKKQRASAYPSIQQQLDMQYWDSVNGTTTWQDAINAVKAQYPKP